jgi:hypothetical protein
MDPLQFALTVIIIAVFFLSFALALTAILIGNRTNQANTVKLFKAVMKRLSDFLNK